MFETKQTKNKSRTSQASNEDNKYLRIFIIKRLRYWLHNNMQLRKEARVVRKREFYKTNL